MPRPFAGVISSLSAAGFGLALRADSRHFPAQLLVNIVKELTDE
jgi:hypothetical protein